jgi:CTP synthase (UTP-ammonia lyase)
VEYVRNVLGFRDADHEETNPDASRLAVTALACSLVGQTEPVRVVADSLAAALYGRTEVVEPFYCNFGVNPEYVPLLEKNGLRVSGFGKEGAARIVELPSHPFFLATLYVPQARSTEDRPHPVIAGFVEATRHQ